MARLDEEAQMGSESKPGRRSSKWGWLALVFLLSVSTCGTALLVWYHVASDTHGSDDLAEALYSACVSGDRSEVESLLSRGAPIDVVHPAARAGSTTALDTCVRFGRQDLVELLVSHGADVHLEDPLASAAAANDVGIARFLLAHGADPNYHREGGIPTPLLGASTWGHLEVLQVLVKSGVDLHDPPGGLSAIGQAASMGHVDVVQYLIDNGVNANVGDADGRTPLHRAALSGESGVVLLLCGAGASVTAQDASGKTPLHIAAEAGHEEIVRILLSHGADRNAKDVDNRTPRELAEARGHIGVAQLLQR